MANEDLLAILEAELDSRAETGGPPREVAEGTLPSGGRAFDFGAGLAKFFFDRAPGMGGAFPDPADTFAATAGNLAAPIVAGGALGVATGGQSLLLQMLAQGGLSAGIEGLRSEATPGDVGVAGTLGTLGTGVGGFAARVATSIARGAGNLATRAAGAQSLRPVIDFADDLRGGFINSIARARSGAGAFNFALKNNVKAMNERVARVFEFTDQAARRVTELGDDFLRTARAAVNRNYKNAEPTGPVNVAAVRETVERIPARLTPGVKDTLNMIDDYAGEPIPATAWQPLQRLLRDTAGDLRGAPDGRAWARVADEAIDQLDASAALSGGNKALLGRANQQFKLLATLEEVNAVIEAGEIPAGQLVRLMGRNNFKGFGRRAIAEGLPKGIMPEIAEVLRAGKQMAKFSRDIAGGSATAGRQATFGPAQTAIQGLLSGDLPLGQAAVKAASGLVTPGIGRASTEAAGAGTRAVAGAVGQAVNQADSELRRK